MGPDSISLLSVIVALVVGGVLLLWVHHCSLGWRGATKSGARLPKGTFGWPIIGETLQLAKNPVSFGASHVKRYGSVFKSSLLMRPTIVGSTPDFSKFVLGNSKLFHVGYPPMVFEILGPKAFLTKDGPSHIALKKIATKPLLPETLKTKVDQLDDLILHHLSSWVEKGTVVGREATEEITLDASIFLNLGVRDFGKTTEGRELLENFELLNKALFSAPIKLPGTAFDKGLKGKARLSALIKIMLNERKKKNTHSNDVLGILLAARDDEEAIKEVKDLDDDMVADNIIMMLFGAYDTTATTLVWVLKCLNENPDVFSRLQAEHQAIVKEKAGPRLSWDDIKKMEYTRKVFQEILRVISIGHMLPRKATEDVEYKGHLIPKGWTVGTMHHHIHQNPEFYPDPSRFNPDRFNVTPKPYTYMPFSSGVHMCPGGEVAKLISSIVIHHLCATFKHESAAPDKGLEYNSFLLPVTGYPIKVRRL